MSTNVAIFTQKRGILFDFIDTKYPQIPESIKETKELTADNEKALIAAIEEFKKTFIQ